MSKSTYPLKLPLSIERAAQRLAKEDGAFYFPVKVAHQRIQTSDP